MASGSKKSELFFTDEQLPVFFRKLADSLESGEPPDEAAEIRFKDFSSLKLGVKRRFAQNVVKLKVKHENVYLPEKKGQSKSEAYPVKYKSLKKRMKGDFKHIVQAVKSGQLPPREISAAFLEDSRVMCLFPEKGDEYYPDYLAACENFRSAVEEQDMEALKKSVAELSRLKGECHDRYK